MSARVAIYARVSTTNHGQDAGMQTSEMRQFAEARGWTLADAYVDSGVSGAKDSRPELNRLMADAHKRRFDVVLVWKLDHRKAVIAFGGASPIYICVHRHRINVGLQFFEIAISQE